MGANYVIMFIGWEGVGLCSYLLIGYWFKNTEYNKAANKAFIMNRIGDLGVSDRHFLDHFNSVGSCQLFARYLALRRSVNSASMILQLSHFYYLSALPVKVHRYHYIPGCPMRWPVPHLYRH